MVLTAISSSQKNASRAEVSFLAVMRSRQLGYAYRLHRQQLAL
ncbi:hypothetical protein [Microseira wollei]|nr:hypothetical protein [Microseira wollei]